MTDITANVVVSMPSQLFTMARSFKAVANGKIYIGKIDTDPVNPENQIQVYVENEDGSHVPVSQPIIINAAGYPVYNGQIAKFVTVQGHSMAVYDAYGAQQFYFPNVLKYDPDQFRTLVGDFYGFGYVGGALYNQIREYNGQLDHIYCFGRLSPFDGAEGIFYRDDLDVASADNDGTIIVDALNRRWKRQFHGAYHAAWFGAIDDGVTNSTTAINNLLSAAGVYSKIEFAKGVYISSGLHNILEGQNIKFNGATFKSDGTASTHEFFFVNADNVSLNGPFTIDGESRNPGERYPKIAIGVRVGNITTARNFMCDRFNGVGTVYALYITSTKNSLISNCYTYRNGDGFRIASNTTGVLDPVGVENLKYENCVAEENGWIYLPTDGTVFTTSSGGFKVTDVAIKNLTYENCTAIGNCAHGFDYHSHDYASIPPGFVQDGIRYINCRAISNNTPEAYLPVGQVAPLGICSGFYLASGGVPVYNVVIENCASWGHTGEALFNISLDNLNSIVGLRITNFDILGAPRSPNTSVRTTNSVFRFNRVRDLEIDDLILRNVEGLYNFVGYHQNQQGVLKYSGAITGNGPNLIYAQALSTDASSRLILRDFSYRKSAKLDPAVQAVGIRCLDFSEIDVQGITLLDGDATAPMVYGIMQQNPVKDTVSIKISGCRISGINTTQKISGAAIEVATRGGSKLFSGNTIANAANAFSGGGTENAILIGNHVNPSDVTNAILNFPPSTIKRGNFGFPDS
ncbi:phage tailspike protein [Escherichia albertii]|nr:phage tailspike protein [Escherichia albertii]